MKKHHILLIILALIVILLSGCSGNLITPRSWTGLSANDTTVFVSSNSFIYALDIENGKEFWRYPEEAEKNVTFYATPMLNGNTIFIGDYAKTLYKLDMEDGDVIWTFDESQDRYIDSPLILEDYVLAPSSDNTLYILDKEGNLVWKFTAGQALWAKPAVDEGIIYLTSMDHHLYALDLEAEKELWSLDLGAAAVASPLLDENGMLYISTLAKEVLAVDTAKAKIVWRFSDAVDGVWCTPVLHEGVLYFGDTSGVIYAIEASSGMVKWLVETNSTITASGALFEEGILFVNENGEIIEVDFEGKDKTWNKIEGKLYTTPVIVGEQVLIAVTDNKDLLVVSLDLDGKELWTFSPEK